MYSNKILNFQESMTILKVWKLFECTTYIYIYIYIYIYRLIVVKDDLKTPFSIATTLRRVLETWCHSDSSEKPSANTCVCVEKKCVWLILMFFFLLVYKLKHHNSSENLPKKKIAYIYIYIYIYTHTHTK